MTQIKAILLAVFAMCIAVTASNILVQYQFPWLGLHNILTFGAFTYPFAFLINDLTNRRFGPHIARRVVYVGFITGLIVSWALATPRLALASGAAFLCAQLLDIAVFNPLRRASWWKAPLAAAVAGSFLDTLIFFSFAFASTFSFLDYWTGMPDNSITDTTVFLSISIPVWLTLAFGDLSIKLIMALIMLIPYGALLKIFMPKTYQGNT